MPIIQHLGRTVKEYTETGKKKVEELINKNAILCERCLKAMKRHSSYNRKIKETGETLTIIMVWCKECKIWHALLPDFMLPNKHYSGNEIESVIIDSETCDVNEIETEASEGTVRRWIKEISDKIRRSVSILKYIFKRCGKAISEIAIEAGSAYSELEQVLGLAPVAIKYSGNKLGLANLWLGTNEVKAYI